jgi:OOP family OmpA-OmpF porin
MRSKSVMAVGAILALGLSGCAMSQRRWSYCAAAGGLIGAAAGAGTAGGLVNAYEGGDGGSHAETGAAAGGGAVAGALVGTLLGHLICDPVEEAPPPPPPAAPPPPPAPPKKMTLSADTFFDFDKATLKPAGEQKVDEVVQALKADPRLRALVEGHTDSVGSDAYNQRLSERRAKAVRDYMVSQGIDSTRISTRGYGETKPVASNTTAEGRAKNRRVEITEE